MSDRLREGFEAVACVEIRKVAIFCHRIKTESDTPRKAGGLMSWAASKAVGLMV